MSQTSLDRVNSRRVRTHEKNLGDAVRRLGTIIQSIFGAQSGASIRLTVWKWSGTQGLFRLCLKTFVAPSPRPEWPPLGLRGWPNPCTRFPRPFRSIHFVDLAMTDGREMSRQKQNLHACAAVWRCCKQEEVIVVKKPLLSECHSSSCEDCFQQN